MSFRGLSESDRIRRKKGTAVYTNYNNNLLLQSGCTINTCVTRNCILRYPSYAYREDVDTGAQACACGCTAATTPVEMFSAVMSVTAPVSFTIRTFTATRFLIVSWGDGTSNTYETASDGVSPGYRAIVSHTYASSGNYTITASSPVTASLYILDITDISLANSLSSIFFTDEGRKKLAEIDLTFNNLLTSLDLSNCFNLEVISLNNNTFSSSAVNSILDTLVNNGVIGGLIRIENQTPPAPPTTGPPNGIAAKATLLAEPRNWVAVATD